MKPATKKADAEVWKLYHAGVAPKDIVTKTGLTIKQVYNGLHRERIRRGIKIQAKGRGRPRNKKDGKKQKKRNLR